ncbi:MAG: type II toxin-antitoxin system HicA family toxin [Gammaproteobacteria bacterium]
MVKSNKTLEKMRHNPKNWRIQEIENIARKHGINVRKGKGSHVVLEHPDWIELLTIPAHRPIKPVYVRKLIRLIENVRQIEDETE